MLLNVKKPLKWAIPRGQLFKTMFERENCRQLSLQVKISSYNQHFLVKVDFCRFSENMTHIKYCVCLGNGKACEWSVHKFKVTKSSIAFTFL
jgi:hypothetical protein